MSSHREQIDNKPHNTINHVHSYYQLTILAQFMEHTQPFYDHCVTWGRNNCIHGHSERLSKINQWAVGVVHLLIHDVNHHYHTDKHNNWCKTSINIEEMYHNTRINPNL